MHSETVGAVTVSLLLDPRSGPDGDCRGRSFRDGDDFFDPEDLFDLGWRDGAVRRAEERRSGRGRDACCEEYGC